MITVVRRAARPGVFSLPLVSSLMVRQTSQPQKMNSDSEMPAVNAAIEATLKGLSQSRLNATLVAEAVPLAILTKAKVTKPTSTSIWNPTRTYWTSFVVVIPR